MQTNIIYQTKTALIYPENEQLKMVRAASKFTERYLAGFSQTDTDNIIKAVIIMSETHWYQDKRTDGGSYFRHPLRVTANAITLCGIRDPQVIMAALWHDVIEDQPERFLEIHGQSRQADQSTSEQALQFMASRYGARVAQLVKQLSNPDFEELYLVSVKSGDTRDKKVIKNEYYAKHVQEIVTADPDAFAIKLSDFIDNGLKLYRITDQATRKHFIQRYQPVVAIFREGLVDFSDASHPLFSRKEALVKLLNEEWGRICSSVK